MTEDEAKTKWCPFVRYAIVSKYVVSSGANRLGDDVGYHENASQCRCIGSACMAWRPAGYCGLAGKP